mgnify:CR=1 FL=1
MRIGFVGLVEKTEGVCKTPNAPSIRDSNIMCKSEHKSNQRVAVTPRGFHAYQQFGSTK